MKKVFLSAFTATSLLLSSSPIFAAPLTISLGIPQEHTITEKSSANTGVPEISRLTPTNAVKIILFIQNDNGLILKGAEHYALHPICLKVLLHRKILY